MGSVNVTGIIARIVCTAGSAAAAGAIMAVAPAFAQAPAVQTRPIDRANLDTTCAACTDFYRYANGGWMKRATIPAAYPMWGTYFTILDRTDSTLHSIVEDARHDAAAAPGSNVWKIGTFYGTCMDSTAIDAAGITPLEPVLRRISAVATPADVPRVIGELRRQGIGVLFGFGASQDPKHSNDVIAIASQGGLGLPTRDYYTRTDERAAALRKAYVAHVAKTLELSGESAGAAEGDADRIMALEMQLAASSMTNVQQRDPQATYHKLPLADVQALTPHFDWQRFLTTIGASRVSMIDVRQPDFFRTADTLLVTVPVETWKAYLRWHVSARAASALSSAFVKEDFDYSRNFSGATEMLPRWRRCLGMTQGALAEAIGQEYVKRTFSPRAKARAVEMVNNLQAALKDRIQALTWMSAATKQEALAKLTTMLKKVSYPDRWRDYSTLVVTKGPFVDNLLESSRWSTARNLEKIGKPADRVEWQIYPQTVDAQANGTLNSITIPAGITQFPLFDPNADDAVNYGAIGNTIGHEMTHLFDDTGRQFDSHGNLRDWWTAQDAANYKQRAQLVAGQFDAYTLPDSVTHVNGQLTLGENIADLGGMKVAYEALQKALAKKGRPASIDGFTPEQRFFLSYAQFWRRVVRPEYERTQVQTDPHAPWMWRVDGPLSNMPEFAKAFGCKPGDAMVRPPDQRAQIW